MKKWCMQFACLMAVFLSATATLMAQEFGGTGVAGHFGTTGWGVEIVQSLYPTVNVRLGLNRYDGNYTGTEDQVDYTVDVHLQSVGLLTDWHPYGGVFRVTGGVLYNGNQIQVIGLPHESLRIGNSTYSPSEIGTLTYDVGFRKIAPYLGFGFGNALKQPRSFSFVLDFGLIFHGFPDVEISSSGPGASLTQFQSDLLKEELELEEDLQPLRYYPVIAVGFTYRFR